MSERVLRASEARMATDPDAPALIDDANIQPVPSVIEGSATLHQHEAPEESRSTKNTSATLPKAHGANEGTRKEEHLSTGEREAG